MSKYSNRVCVGQSSRARDSREVRVLVEVEVENEEDDEEYFFFSKPARVALVDVRGWDWIYRCGI
jgi:hypothetical protein